MYIHVFATLFLIVLVHPPDEQLGFFRLRIQLSHFRMRVLRPPYIRHDRCQPVQARVRTLDAQHHTTRRQHVRLLLLLETCHPHQRQDFRHNVTAVSAGMVARARVDESGRNGAKTGGNRRQRWKSNQREPTALCCLAKLNFECLPPAQNAAANSATQYDSLWLVCASRRLQCVCDQFTGVSVILGPYLLLLPNDVAENIGMD